MRNLLIYAYVVTGDDDFLARRAITIYQYGFNPGVAVAKYPGMFRLGFKRVA